MKMKEWVRAELNARLPINEPMPPFTAIETLMCEFVDRLIGLPTKHPSIRPHEAEVFDNKMRKVDHAISEEINSK